ncbi:MAG TPA: hypothetical protein DDY49_03325 [Paenibacillaceae bacterium]|nr:hypothetical protein [Paenibacillaceae bacterium]
MGRNLLRRSPAYLPPFDSSPKPNGKHTKGKKTKKNKGTKHQAIPQKKKEKKGKHTPFLVNDIKIVQSHSYKKTKKTTETHHQLMDYLFSQVEEQKNISAEIYDKIAQYDSLLNQVLHQNRKTEEKVPIPKAEDESEAPSNMKMSIPLKKADHSYMAKPSFKNIVDLLNSLNPCTKVDSIAINDSIIDVDTFVSYNPLNQLVYFLRDRNVVVVNATQIHEIGFLNIS